MAEAAGDEEAAAVFDVRVGGEDGHQEADQSSEVSISVVRE